MRGLWRVNRVIEQIFPRAAILLYHRVAESVDDPQLLCVSPVNFKAHLEILRRRYRPRSLEQLVNDSKRRGFNRTVVVTFDDGYADNLFHAKPLLEEYEISATVFVVAGYVGKMQEYYWDELARIFLSANRLPNSLQLSIAGTKYRRSIESEIVVDSAFARRWSVVVQKDPSQRHTVYRELTEILKTKDCQVRDTALSNLAAWSHTGSQARESHRVLTSDELRKLNEDGLVSVGSHTMTHPTLSALSLEAQTEEIVQSKKRLEEITKRSVTSFSYPYGTKSDYSNETVRLVKDTGFECACSNFPGFVTKAADRYQMPRFLVRNWDGDEFARRLEAWFQH